MGTLRIIGIAAFAVVHVGCGEVASEQVGSAPSAATLASGYRHTCAVPADGTLWCWGGNYSGNLGLGHHSDVTDPQRVGADSDWSQVAAGAFTSCAIKRDASLWCWGSNTVGQIGATTSVDHLVPTRVGFDNDWVKVAGGGSHTCGIRRSGTLWCWGGRDYGQFQHGEDLSDPPPGYLFTHRTVGDGAADAWIDVSANFYTVCAVRSDGAMWCAQDSEEPSPLKGRETDPPWVFDFVRVGEDTDWARVAVGVLHVCAIKRDGSLWCWTTFEGGDDGFPTSSTPTPVGDFDNTKWISVAATYHTCAIQSDHSVWCFGRGEAGELGGGQAEPVAMQPQRVPTIGRVREVSTSAQHTCAVGDVGGVWCWGAGGYVGRGGKIDQLVPSGPAAVHDRPGVR